MPGFVERSKVIASLPSLSLLTLEVYYRHPPLFKRSGDGIAALEK